jgi:hypothetical protein
MAILRVSAAHINKERAERNKLPLSDEFVLDEFEKYAYTATDPSIDTFNARMIHELE